MYKYVWYFDEKDFEKCKTENEGDYVGNIRVGNICFDIIQIEDDASLWVDCYVGGVDSGYGYSMDKSNYPYDYADDVGASIPREEYRNLTYKQFVSKLEKELTDNINNKSIYTTNNGIVVNLIDKANEPLKVW